VHTLSCWLFGDVVALAARGACAHTGSGSIGGYARDTTGRVIPKANVSLKIKGANEVRALAANGAGCYAAGKPPPGSHRKRQRS
jgi:hypothetical protein